MRSWVIGLAIVLLVAGVAGAQPVSAGTSVRIWAPVPPLSARIATFRAVRGDTIALVTAAPGARMDGAGELLVPLATVSRLEVRMPRSAGRGAWRGAWRGALAGTAVGLVIGLFGVAADNCGLEGPCSSLLLLFAPPAGFAGGLAVGAVIGAAHPGDRWACPAGAPCLQPVIRP